MRRQVRQTTSRGHEDHDWLPQYSQHALDRMSQRGIRKAWVESCLKNAEVVVEPAKGLRQSITTMADGRRIKVVVDVDKDIVVTVMWQ